MTNYMKTPTYNLNAVLLETGLKADLVRAWERRYDLPKPQRTSGGHRLYSQYDIEILKWLKEKQTQGLSISHAVKLWKSIEESGQNPLANSVESGRQEGVTTTGSSETLTELRRNWIKACERFDNIGSEDVLNLAFAVHPVETVVSEILQKGLNEIGTGWHEGRITVQQEHFASSLAERRLQTLLSLTPPPTRPQTILLGCPPGELHALPITILELFLRRKGFRVIYLGADVPIDQMIATTLKLRPNLIVLAAQTIKTAASLMETFSALQASGITLAYGGFIFNRVPSLRGRIPAHFLGEDLYLAAHQTESLLTSLNVARVSPVEENQYPGLADLFEQKRSAIEFFVQQRMSKFVTTIEHITEGNQYFSRGLLAALKLGNLAYLETDLKWVGPLLHSRKIYGVHLRDYLKAYRDAIQEYMGVEGAPIAQWLDALMA